MLMSGRHSARADLAFYWSQYGRFCRGQGISDISPSMMQERWKELRSSILTLLCSHPVEMPPLP
jgi:hypothetical protein